MSRIIRAPRGNTLRCKGWVQEAALRMLMNNLDPEVAEDPDQLIVYGGSGKAARNWEAFDAIVASLESLEDDVQKNAGGNKAAGTRARKGLRSLKSAAADLVKLTLGKE